MLRDSTRACLVLAAAVALAACAPERTPVDLRLSRSPSVDPWAGADTAKFVLEADGVPIDEWSFPADAASGSLAPLPPGDGLTLRVDVLGGGVPLARGRSFPFELVEGAAPPHPDVYVGRLGRFAPPLASTPGAPARAIVATSDGALVACADGALLRYRAHDRRDGRPGDPTLELLANVPSAVDRTFVGFGPGLLLAFGGSAGDALLYDGDGTLLDSLPSDTPGLAVHAYDATTAPLARGAVLVVGGTATPGGSESAAVARIDAVPEGNGRRLELVELPPLPTARRGARAAPVSVRGRPDCPCERVVVVAGMAGASVVGRIDLVDPDGNDPTTEIVTDAARSGAVLLPILPGHVVIAGGEAADGTAVARVDVLILQIGAIELAPAPPPLFFPRRGASGAVFAEGLGIVVGGFDETGAAIATAELLDYPGEAIPTGPLSSPIGDVRAALLGDATLLVAGDGLLDAYVLPRGP